MATQATLAALAKLTSLREGVLARTARADFADDPARFKAFSVTLDDLLFDYSKQRIDAGVLSALVELAKAAAGRSPARRDVRGRENQRHREPRRPAHRLAQFLRQAGPGRRPRRHAGRDRHAGKDAELRRRRARGTRAGRSRPADDRRHQYRHRRLRSRPRHGCARARRHSRRRNCAATSSPTSMAPTSATRCAGSIRRGRCSSSHRRPSPRWRR